MFVNEVLCFKIDRILNQFEILIDRILNQFEIHFILGVSNGRLPRLYSDCLVIEMGYVLYPYMGL